MITAIVRYKLPPTIGKNECLAHFHKIAPGFAKEKGFIRKQFIWNENGIAGRLPVGNARRREGVLPGSLA